MKVSKIEFEHVHSVTYKTGYARSISIFRSDVRVQHIFATHDVMLSKGNIYYTDEYKIFAYLSNWFVHLCSFIIILSFYRAHSKMYFFQLYIFSNDSILKIINLE